MKLKPSAAAAPSRKLLGLLVTNEGSTRHLSLVNHSHLCTGTKAQYYVECALRYFNHVGHSITDYAVSTRGK